MSRRAEIDPEVAERLYAVLGSWVLVAERMTPPGRAGKYQPSSVMAAVRKARHSRGLFGRSNIGPSHIRKRISDGG